MYNISQVGIDLIKKFEGCSLKAYRCPSNVLTIGYGHTRGVSEDMTITQGMADALLLEDLQNFVNEVNLLLIDFRFLPNQNQFDAMVSFAFNCGIKALGTCMSQVATIEQLPNRMILYNKSNGKVLKGLEDRRKKEIELFTTPENITFPIGIVNVTCQFAFYGDIDDGYYILDCGRGRVAKLPIEYVNNGCNMIK